MSIADQKPIYLIDAFFPCALLQTVLTRCHGLTVTDTATLNPTG